MLQLNNNFNQKIQIFKDYFLIILFFTMKYDTFIHMSLAFIEWFILEEQQ